MGKIERLLRDCVNDVHTLANHQRFINSRDDRSKFAAIIMENLKEVQKEISVIKKELNDGFNRI